MCAKYILFAIADLLSSSFGIGHLCKGYLLWNDNLATKPSEAPTGISMLSKVVQHRCMLLYLILNLTWFKWIADVRISCNNKQRPPLLPSSHPPFPVCFCAAPHHLWDWPVLFGQWWRMWFERALDLTHIFSAATLTKPQVLLHIGWLKADGLRRESWGFLISNHVV